nr:GSCFA domain-containing protein [Muribaculaceae bacterium]
AEYFPSYEIMLDALRDYRFYAADMKHPSETAVDYIYERFSESYFTQSTLLKATAARKAALRSQHRPNL